MKSVSQSLFDRKSGWNEDKPFVVFQRAKREAAL